MNKPSINIQDGFLFQSLKDGRAMSIELVTGKHLEGSFAAFGRVTKGMEVVDTLVNQPKDKNDMPLIPITMDVNIVKMKAKNLVKLGFKGFKSIE